MSESIRKASRKKKKEKASQGLRERIAAISSSFKNKEEVRKKQRNKTKY